MMVRKIGIVAVLLACGVGIAMYLRGKPAEPEQPNVVFTPRTGASDTDRIADLEKALAAQVDRSNLLESRLKELEARPGWGGNRRNANGNADDPGGERFGGAQRQQFLDADGNFDPSRMREAMRAQQLDRLVQAGFTRERAEWIERRSQELQLQMQQAQYDAQRSGQPVRGVDADNALRKEMGDAEYEKYLKAMGQRTEVQVMDVLASSTAEKAGLKAGDQIVSYAGQRVFDMRDLNSLTRQGTPGETVTVEVQRNGQTVQLQVTRGVLGVESGGGRGPGGGGPGGFGGPRAAFGGGPPGGRGAN
jgi:hypothetical protein